MTFSVDEATWKIRKKQFLDRFRRELKEGRVDPDIVDLLEMLNQREEYYTTSSCSGRIQVFEARHPGDKFNITILGKWHAPVPCEEVRKAIKKAERYAWLVVQSPILHVVARDMLSALKMLTLAREVGFKHSGIQSIRHDRIVVEVLGSERIAIPVLWNGEQLVADEALEKLVEVCNYVLSTSKERLQKLKETLRAGALDRVSTDFYSSGER